MLQAVTYELAPPYHAERVGKKAKGREKIRGNLASSKHNAGLGSTAFHSKVAKDLGDTRNGDLEYPVRWR